MDRDDIARRTAANRRRLADFYDSLDDADLATPSLCPEWTVRDLLGHLVMPLHVRAHRLLLSAVRAGSIHRASVDIAREIGTADVSTLTATLRREADRRVVAPGVGPMGQFADGCLHFCDAAVPLDRPVTVPDADWHALLAWLPSRQASLGTTPKGLLDGLSFAATDGPWRYGSGPRVTGPAHSLALALSGRTVGLAGLSGDGLPELRRRLTP